MVAVLKFKRLLPNKQARQTVQTQTWSESSLIAILKSILWIPKVSGYDQEIPDYS